MDSTDRLYNSYRLSLQVHICSRRRISNSFSFRLSREFFDRNFKFKEKKLIRNSSIISGFSDAVAAGKSEQQMQESKASSANRSFYRRKPMPQIEPFFTLESTPAATDYAAAYNSPSAASVSSSRSPFSPDLHQSNISNYGSPLSESSIVDDDSKLMHAFWVLRNELYPPEFNFDNSTSFSGQPSSFSRYNRTLEMAPRMDLKQLLTTCAETVAEADSDRAVAGSAAEALFDILEKKVSVSGDPLQRLGAYMLEGLRARLLSSGSAIYRKLRCNEPTGPELMSYMHTIYELCPYYKFAYASSNAIIGEAMEGVDRIHIIDFQIAQGSQWVSFIESVAGRPGGAPTVRITGVDDSDSIHARGGGLNLVGRRLSEAAKSCGVPFEFHGAAISGSEVRPENLDIRRGEALAVNFPYVLHHIPDESVSTANHRDRLLRLVKSLSPEVVTLVEQESNTNTATFFQRFSETLDYYTAMFESIDAARPRDDRMRINAEEHCVAKDVVNIIACEGVDRVERHELFGKWRSRLSMAGFQQIPVSPSAGKAAAGVLKEYSKDYGLAEGNGALFLGWKNRALSSVSAWR
ncbi:scarecrow-like protein 21 [Andrographis paniculata]|uniref:scarecrow-like protein 21 n=1 Tax=Andrographis paniculata TaxID=175694 RepID=UPI0021E7FC58|nr:scarecrow-like protein 21 [Andrographis paniculata]